METGFTLPLGDIPQHPIPLPENIDSDWISLEKALESYGRIIMHCTSEAMQKETDKALKDLWESAKYSVGDPPDRTKIPIKSPFRPGLTEEKIQHVAEMVRKWFNIDPPEEYLKLLRLTNGVLSCGSYSADNWQRREKEPFSPWEDVESNMAVMMRSTLTEKGIPREIQRSFELAFGPDAELLGGFKCGLVFNEHGVSRGVYLVFFDDANDEPEPGKDKLGKHWELIGAPFNKGWFDPHPTIRELLREWAELCPVMESRSRS
jgi:hypothetical protein